jgi:parallel beta-helix repeat protein
MRKKLVLLTAFAAIFVFKDRSAAADGVTAVSQPIVMPSPDPPLIGVPQVLADLDPLLLDEAVSDVQLLTAGCGDTVPSLLSDPSMLIVDDDKVQCPNAQFTRINDAIAAALPGMIIRVCPGIYRESVVVNKPNLTLQAPRQQGQATQCQDPSPPDPTKEAIVIYNSGNFGAFLGFDVEASNDVIEGFTIQPDASIQAGPPFAIGIFVNPAFSGTDIRHNVAQNGSIGIDVHNNFTVTNVPANVRENCVRNNKLINGGAGIGIYSDVGLHNAFIQHNYCTGNGLYCVLLQGGVQGLPSNTNVQLVHNQSVNDASIALVNSTNIVVDYNLVINPAHGAIFLGAGVDTGEVSFNNLSGGSAPGNGILIRAERLGSGAVLAAAHLDVKSNKVVFFTVDGIRLSQGANSNTIETNRIHDNGRNGMMATTTEGPQPFNNTIQRNHMRQNAMDDCYDDTTGTGTAGTANTWFNDNGATENRPGLCRHGNDT